MRFNAFLISAAAIALTGCGKKTETPQTNGNVPATTDNSVVAPVDAAAPAGGAPAGTTAAVETEAEKEAKKKAEKEAKKKAEKEAAEKAKAEAKAERVAKRANKSLKTQAEMAKEEVAAAKTKIAEERKALEKKLAEKPEEEKKKALAKFDEESVATIEELEDEVRDLIFKRDQDALKQKYRSERNSILKKMEGKQNDADSLKDFAEFILTQMNSGPENTLLIKKTVAKLEKAEATAKKARDEYLAIPVENRYAYTGTVPRGFVSDAIRDEIKATLVKIYKESSFRPQAAPRVTEDDLRGPREYLNTKFAGAQAAEQAREDEIKRDRTIAELQAHLARLGRRV